MSVPQLNKTIGFHSATSIVVGSVVGSGIFMKPATMAAQLGSPYMLIIVWLVAGAVTIFGAMAYAELGCMFPETGGQYIYLKKIYGDLVAYLYGWSGIAVINSAAIAAIAFVCAEYAGYFLPIPRFDTATEMSFRIHLPFIGDIFPLQNAGVKTLAVAIILLFIIINYVSVRMGDLVQLVATILKTAAIILLVGVLLFFGHGDSSHFFVNDAAAPTGAPAMFLAFMAATSGAFMSYDGWSNVNMVAGEIRNPEKNITRSLLAGLLTCIVAYVMVTLAYLYILPIGEMAKSPLVASDAAAQVIGVAGATLIAVLIVISTFGATHLNLLTCARVVFSMAEAKNFFRWTAVVHPKHHTPGNAIIALGAWSCVFVITGSFDILADMFVFMAWVFYGLTVAGLMILRKRMPAAARPYRAWGYPWLPGLFVLFTGFYLVSNLVNDIANYNAGKAPVVNSFLGLVITMLGLPFYWLFKKRNKAV